MLDIINNKFGLIKLDPRTKFLLLIIAMVAFFNWLPDIIMVTFIAMGVVLILLSGYPKAALNYVVLLAIVYGSSYLMAYLPYWLMVLIGIVAASIQFFVPVFVYIMLLVYTSTIEDVAIVLEKLKVPNALSIPILVMFRFIPTIRDEYRHIRSAMVFRGIRPGIGNLLLHPIKTVEYIYVPLLFSLVRIGEELTMSSLTRGLGIYNKRTSIRDQKMALLDYGLLIVYVGLLIYGFMIRTN